MTFHPLLAVVLWQLHELQWNSCLAQLHPRGWTNSPPLFNNWDDAGNHLLQLGVSWDIYLRELRCHREEVLSVMRILFSESVVFHLVFWVSSFVVLVWVVFVFGFVLLRLWKTPGFLLFHLFSNNVRIDDRRQDVFSEGGHVRLHRCALCISFHTTDNRILKVSLHVHIGVSRGPQALWPSCLWRQNINHYAGHATDICPW